MAWYAYCITEQQAWTGTARARRPFPIEDLKGIHQFQAFAYPSGEFCVIVSEHDTQDLTQTSMREHAHVIGECFRTTTVLPFRFGTVFDDDESLRRSVRTNRKHFSDTVARLRGKAEMHIKLRLRDGSLGMAMTDIDLPHSVGDEYLKQLREKASRHRERQTKARALSMQVHKLLNPLAEEVQCRRAQSGAMELDIAHLIEHKSLEKYQNRWSTAQQQFKNCELIMSGPWPPYHFMAATKLVRKDN
ncbi:MAG: GvpL/GvpF family gas vesicle protein [Acidobacteriaceae bacterium]